MRGERVIMRSTRLLALAIAAAAASFASQEAAAGTASFNRTFNTPRGTFTQSGTVSFTPSTGALSKTVTTTAPKGATRTVSYSRQPDGRGGFVVTHSLTSFRGKTYSASRQFGP